MQKYEYDCIFLDSVLYKKAFSQKLQELMRNNLVVIADDFFDTAEGYLPLLNSVQNEIYTYNLNIVKTLHATGHCKSTKGCSGCEDARSTICYLFAVKHCSHICVVTANPLLIEWIISLGARAIDIFNINNDTLCSLQSYAAEKESLRMLRVANRTQAPFIHTGATVYTRDNTAYVLGADIRQGGGEGDLFYVNKPNGSQDSMYVAKIFFEKPSEEKLIFLKNLISESKLHNLSWCTFPVDLLYSGKQGNNRTVVGILMEKTDTPTLKTVSTIMVGDDIDPEINDWDGLRRSELIRYICQIISQSLFLHSISGFIPIDYNAGNLSMPVKLHQVIFFDTDSFVFRRFFSGAVNDSYYTRDYDVQQKTDVIMMAYENLCKLAFTILALGYEPLTSKGYVFDPQRDNQKHEYVKAYFPSAVFAYLESVFLGREEASPYHLHALLFRAVTELKENPENDITIAEMRRLARPKVFGAALNKTSSGTNAASPVTSAKPPVANAKPPVTQKKSAPAAAVPAGGSFPVFRPARPAVDPDMDLDADTDSAKAVTGSAKKKNKRSASQVIKTILVTLIILLLFTVLLLFTFKLTNRLGWTDITIPYFEDFLKSADLCIQIQN